MKRVKRLLAWATSPDGSTRIHRSVTGLLALYVSLHAAGVL